VRQRERNGEMADRFEEFYKSFEEPEPTAEEKELHCADAVFSGSKI